MAVQIVYKIFRRIFGELLIRFVYPITNLFYETFRKDIVVLTTSVNPFLKNWGDDMSIQICKFISPSRKYVIRKYTWNIYKRDDLLCIGSIVSWMTSPKSIIWGSGVVYPNQKISAKPKEVFAVRGPLTRQYLLNNGIDCPEVYGDPALLFPRYYNPKTIKKYKLGIIPHFRDKKNRLIKEFERNKSVLIIDVQCIHPWHHFIDDICSCEYIASSSLHGIIISDAYRVPNVWVEFPDGESKSFAFLDYLKSVHREMLSPVLLSDKMSIDDIVSCIVSETISIDLDKLENVCPIK